MSNLSNPDWYDSLREDQPLRTRTFTKELASGAYEKALAAPAYGARRFKLAARPLIAASLLVAIACAWMLSAAPFAGTSEPDAVSGVPYIEGTVAGELDPTIRDILIKDRPKGVTKRILLQKRVPGNLELIYSVSEEANDPTLYVDVLRWRDYGGDRSVGTGLDGWSHHYSSYGTGATIPVIPGLMLDAIGGYGDLSIFEGKLLDASIAGVRVVNQTSGENWEANVFPGANDSRHWFVDMNEPYEKLKLESFAVEALDAEGNVLSSYDVPR